MAYSVAPILTLPLFEGEWTLELARLDGMGEPIYWKTVGPVRIEDYLIVQLGDSYSSGEGAPDRQASGGYWGDTGTGLNETHYAAHRSSNSWGSLVATQIERKSRQASVTYINLAVSGALLQEIPAQLDQMSALVGDRPVDAVFISIGGNDAGFANAIAAYLHREPIDNFPDIPPNLDDIKSALRTGNWTDGAFTDVGSVFVEIFDFANPHGWQNRLGLNRLAGDYADLAAQLTARGVEPGDVYILQYPDPFVADPQDPNAVCPGPVLTNVASVLGRDMEIGRKEQRRARTDLIQPLNQQIAASATAAGWNVIDAEKVMYGHAICQDARMMVRFNESKDQQGDVAGTLHPNKLGYEAIAERTFAVWFRYAGN